MINLARKKLNGAFPNSVDHIWFYGVKISRDEFEGGGEV